MSTTTTTVVDTSSHQQYAVHDFSTAASIKSTPTTRTSKQLQESRLSTTSHHRQELEVSSENVPSSQATDTSNTQPSPASHIRVKPFRANLIIFQLSMINFLTSVSSGLVVIGLPRIAADLQLPDRLYLWPTSVFGLTTGSTLLIAGAVADVVGPRSVDLVGSTLLGLFTLACGLSGTGIQLVMFRAFQGVSTAMHLPSSVALVARSVPAGRRRNVGFACLGLSQPLGFSVGLVIGGVLVDTIGWRVGFYGAGGIVLVQAACGWFVLPPDSRPQNMLSKLGHGIDWVGAMIAAAGLALFSYILAVLSANGKGALGPSSIAILVLSIALMLAFPAWIRFQEQRGSPALIPNSLWKKLPFVSICILTVITWGVMNAMELFSSLYFQEVQESSALTASLQILPSLIVGVILNFTTGHLVDRVSGFLLLVTSAVLTGIAPLLMALIRPEQPYWNGAFFAQLLSPVAGDVLFTVGLIVVSNIFPEDTQALAGAVFNTVAYFGMALGLNLLQVASLLVTDGSRYRDKSEPLALLVGYRAAFWAMFGATVACVGVCVVGLRGIGRVGLKRD